MSALLRSMLYVPTNNWRMICRATAGTEDAVILDLEDAVPPEEKETGRVFARDSLMQFREAGVGTYVRVNPLATGLTEEDARYVVREELDGIVLPKAETEDDLASLDGILAREEKRRGLRVGGLGVIPLVESPRGVHNVFSVVSSSNRVVAVAFGAGDFLREMGVGFAVTQLSADDYYPLILYARSRIAQASKTAGVEAIDTPYFGMLTDLEGLSRDTERARLLGFTGKQLVHPRQVDAANRAFTPSADDVSYARSAVAAYQDATARGAGAASFRGKMIDHAMYRMGMDLLAKSEAIEQRLLSRHHQGSA